MGTIGVGDGTDLSLGIGDAVGSAVICEELSGPNEFSLDASGLLEHEVAMTSNAITEATTRAVGRTHATLRLLIASWVAGHFIGQL